jgi:uncharacterized integral membrane protein
LAEHRLVDYTVTLAILANLVMLCCEHYSQPGWIDTMLFVQERLFTAVFLGEALLKLSGFGPREYFASHLNRLDIVLVIVSVIALVMESRVGSKSSLFETLRLLRLLRLARIFKILRIADGVMALLITVVGRCVG